MLHDARQWCIIFKILQTHWWYDDRLDNDTLTSYYKQTGVMMTIYNSILTSYGTSNLDCYFIFKTYNR